MRWRRLTLWSAARGRERVYAPPLVHKEGRRQVVPDPDQRQGEPQRPGDNTQRDAAHMVRRVRLRQGRTSCGNCPQF